MGDKLMRLIDLHCDTILRLMENKDKYELKNNNFSVDLEKLKKANSLAQFFAMYVDLNETKDPLQRCLEMIDKFYLELSKNQSDIHIARNCLELEKNNNEGKISAFLTIEEGGVIKGDIENLRKLYGLGVRLITLTWNYPNEIGYPSCLDDCRDSGLTKFGTEVVYEMNNLGMLIDVSHLSDKGFYDVANLSSKPFVASHSNSRSIMGHCRNLSDDMIRTLSEKGGVLGINFEKFFLSESSKSRVDDMIHHIKYIRNVGGIEVISIGTDFDGISPNLEIEDIGQINKLVDALKANKFSEDEIEKICYRNALRVIKDVLI
jgi:membrane dipeptidase